MSVFSMGQDYRAKLIFDHMARHLFEIVTREHGSVQFIQVGANDGQRADPIQSFIRSGRWNGIMIEPVPAVFAKLRETHRRRMGTVSFENCAIGSQDGNAIFYACREPHSPLSSFDKGNIEKHSKWALSLGLPDPADCIEEIVVPVSTLETICKHHGIDRLDVLVTDTEGHDCKAIQSLDLKNRRPLLIHFEHVHCPDDDTDALKATLSSLDYEFICDGYNACAVSPKFADHLLVKTFQEILIDASLLRKAQLSCGVDSEL
jgi:FkbM family methyltransferase